MINSRVQIKDILSKTLNFDSVDDYVSVNFTHDLVDNKLIACFNELNTLLNQISTFSSQLGQNIALNNEENNEQQMRKDAIQELVSQIFQQQHPKKQLVLLRLIGKLISSRMIEVRFVCEFMLNNLSHFNLQSANQPTNITTKNHSITNNYSPKSKTNSETSTYIWCKVLEFIRKLIPSLDYKSCRDIFKMHLDVIKKMPHSNSSVPPPLENEHLTSNLGKRKLDSKDEVLNNKMLLQNSSRITDDIKLESLYETISFLLDKENYIMPRYLAINEIKSVLTFGKESYHPRFHYIFTTFIESFIPTAHLISVSGRDRLLPIVGCSNLYSQYSFWRFNPATCKFNTSGPLPYFKHVSKPHHDVFFYLLRQNTQQYLLLGLMSLQRNIKTILPLFEDEFASVIYETMEHTEKISDNNFENLRIWNNLINQLVNLTQIIHLPTLIKTLSTRIKDKVEVFQVSRNWLTWFLLNIITSYMNRNCIPEFSDLHEILYKDEEMLTNPDLSSFTSVIQLSPLSIWIHLNLRMSNQNQEGGQSASQTSVANRASRHLIVPEVIKNHSLLLQECMNTQRFQDFGSSVCMNAYSTETTYFSPPLNYLLEKIGRTAMQQQATINNPSTNSTSPNGSNNSIFTNHQPLSFEMIGSFTLHVRIHATNYLTCILIQKPQICKILTLNIPAAIIETFARLLIFDPDNFIKYFTPNLWGVLILCMPNNLPPVSSFQLQQQQQQSPQNPNIIQTTFLHQQLNLLIELIAFRLKHLSFTHRTTFLVLLNNLFIPQQQQTQQQQPPINYIKHPQIYYNAQIAMLKILISFTGSDHYELMNSILSPTKHSPRYFINPDSEEINKAIIIVIARTIVLASSDLHPLENKDKDDNLKSLLNEIMKVTPVYFPDHMIQNFPKVLNDYFTKDQIQMKNERFYLDSSNMQYKSMLKQKVNEDYARFLETRSETQNQQNFHNNQSQIPINTLFCILFRLIQDEQAQQQNFKTYLSFVFMILNGLENKKISQAIRTLCDYVVIESGNKNKIIIDNFATIIVKMINNFNVFSYDRFLFTIAFRNFDSADFQLVLDILNAIFVKGIDFQSKYNDFMNLWNSICGEKGEWNPAFYSQYIRMHPEKFFYEGMKEQINIQTDELVINTYYGNMPMRCVPVLDFLNNRYIEHEQQSLETDSLFDNLNQLYKFHGNRISYVYNTLVYYNNRFESEQVNKLKKKRLLNILTINQNSIMPQFSDIFRNCVTLNQPLPIISIDYYYMIIQKLVKRMLDINQHEEFIEYSNEFRNPSCQLLYTILCELISLEIFSNDSLTLSRGICTSIFDLFFVSCFRNQGYTIDQKEFVYWINASGLVISNLPEPYWYSIYERLANIMKTNALLNSTESTGDHTNSKLFDHFDLFLAEEKNCFDEVTLIIALFHSIWCHSNANHFQYFVKFFKERRLELVKSEAHFLFVCKLIGPFLSKIHIENTNLLINLVEELYDMINIVNANNINLYHMETMCNFFYHLKYRHIGESIKEKIHSLMPNLRPELKVLFKYITSELNQQQLKLNTSPLVTHQAQSKIQSQNLATGAIAHKNIINAS